MKRKSYSETVERVNGFEEIKNEFNFECQMCGLCCSGLQDVWLEPYDIFRLSRFGFKEVVTTNYLFEKEILEIVFDEKLNLPFCKIKFKNELCPFLEKIENYKFGCKLHKTKGKPFVCQLSPIARTLDESFNEKFYIVAPDENCKGMEVSKNQNLENWLENLKEERVLEYSKEFYQILEKVGLQSGTVENLWELLYNFDRNSKIYFKEFNEVWFQIKKMAVT
ncbi:MAG: hypothetical protein DWQ06_06125 [Calditrichaeota bacterium]|nr:MAG: hypothetical protein DWQ06_06125 [Calditrichota bacterium]